MSAGGVDLIRFVVLAVIPRLALPVDGAVFGCGRVVVKTFPPDRVEFGVVANVGEDGITLGRSQRVGVGVLVGAGRYAEETVLRVHGVQSAVLFVDAQPCDVVTDRPYFIALLLVDFRRNEHGKVGFAAGRGECGSDIFDLAVRIFQTQDQHMLCHPALFSAKVGGNAKCKALLAEQHVSAVTGVDGHDGVVLREVGDIAVLFVKSSLGVKPLDVIRAVTQRVNHFFAHAGHNQHIEYNVNGVGQLNADLGKIRTDNTHGVGNHVHRSALHGAVVKLFQSGIHLIRFYPVVDVACFLFGGGADKGSAFHTCHVVDRGAVQVAVGEQLFVQLDQLAGGAGFLAECLRLFLAAVDPNDLIRLGHCGHFIDPGQNVLVVGHNFHLLSYLVLHVAFTQPLYSDYDFTTILPVFQGACAKVTVF